MKNMKTLLLSVLLTAQAGFVGSSYAQVPAEPRLGQEYTVLQRQMPVENKNKVEVIEFFGYFCPACNGFEPVFEEWIKANASRIEVKRVHVNFHQMVTQQKLFYTLEAMGKIDEYQMKTFNAYHVDRNRLSTDEQVMKYVEKSGLDKNKFTELYHSFSIQSKVTRSAQLMNDYKVDGVPTIIIDGKYVASPAELGNRGGNTSSAKTHYGAQVMTYLVNKVAKEKGIGAAAPSTANATTNASSSTAKSSASASAKKK